MTHTIQSDFGFTPLQASEQRQSLVNAVFASVAGNYDRMNDAMSLGLHRAWKQAFVRPLTLQKEQTLLDVAGGTGDIARLVYDKSHGQGQYIICDINPAMLQEGHKRMAEKGYDQAFQFIIGNGEALPFDDAMARYYTNAFGLRNMTDIRQALAEAYRVLDHGGQAHIMEFSPTVAPMLQGAYDWYSFTVLPKLGQWLANDAEAYQYLAESIRRFPVAESILYTMREVGFFKPTVRTLNGGMVSIFSGWKV